MKKAARYLLLGAGFAALLSFAFAAPAEAHPGHRGHHHGHLPAYGPRYRPVYGRGYWGPRYRGPRISVGVTVPILPAGYVNLAVGGVPYYYSGGYYYRPAPRGFVVVNAPLGAAVLTLPGSAVRVQIGGLTYYQYGASYYQWRPHMNRYVVVPAPVATVAAAPVVGVTQQAYSPGQVVNELPVGYTAEVINGIQYYRYGGHYFMPTQRDGREVYVVVQV
ncbi:hypothetical protein Mag101_16225 [Microbulbifer agarilyticus]|uniref:Uncharacterized protein n=1 Tax=Microbulbifer agarilyticus TaxID=260552 RepID=A0A1Q2M9P9_9GAMM|nr:DUF6515 family protein [Microbulbifer agarilyticus]AQQ69007.1 hypothetical protein Mag101_16225 [Microbulbifer agarilyticus]